MASAYKWESELDSEFFASGHQALSFTTPLRLDTSSAQVNYYTPSPIVPPGPPLASAMQSSQFRQGASSNAARATRRAATSPLSPCSRSPSISSPSISSREPSPLTTLAPAVPLPLPLEALPPSLSEKSKAKSKGKARAMPEKSKQPRNAFFLYRQALPVLYPHIAALEPHQGQRSLIAGAMWRDEPAWVTDAFYTMQAADRTAHGLGDAGASEKERKKAERKRERVRERRELERAGTGRGGPNARGELIVKLWREGRSAEESVAELEAYDRAHVGDNDSSSSNLWEGLAPLQIPPPNSSLAFSVTPPTPSFPFTPPSNWILSSPASSAHSVSPFGTPTSGFLPLSPSTAPSTPQNSASPSPPPKSQPHLQHQDLFFLQPQQTFEYDFGFAQDALAELQAGSYLADWAPSDAQCGLQAVSPGSEDELRALQAMYGPPMAVDESVFFGSTVEAGSYDDMLFDL